MKNNQQSSQLVPDFSITLQNKDNWIIKKKGKGKGKVEVCCLWTKDILKSIQNEAILCNFSLILEHSRMPQN